MTKPSGTGVNGAIVEGKVDRRLYVEQDVFDSEVESLWRTTWICIGHESEVPDGLAYRTMVVIGEPLLMVRGADDTVRVFYNSCPHRANVVCHEPEGSSRHLRCAYHGWTFDHDGQLVGLPSPDAYEDGGERFRTDGLSEVTSAERAGFIFIRFGDAGESLDDHLGSAGVLLDRAVEVSPTHKVSLQAGWNRQHLATNWKQVFENQLDGYHVPFTHRSLLSGGKGPRGDAVSYGRQTLVRSVALGRGHAEIDFRPSYRDKDGLFAWFGGAKEESLGEYVSDMRDALGEERANEVLVDGPPHAMVFPNLFLAEMNVYIILPVSAGSTTVMMTPMTVEGYPELNRRAVHRANGALGSAGLYLADDAEMGERNQLGLSASKPRWLDTSRGLHTETVDGDYREGHMEDDVASREFWREYARLMGVEL